MTPFCASYLKAQGVHILQDTPKPETREIREKRSSEFVPVVPEYERW